jgi:threonine/homoserine/homoserine lactone efflux protein
LKASYNFREQEDKSLGFIQGLMLNILNPKLVVYAFTLFSAFLLPLTKNLMALTATCVLLAFVSFCSTTIWAVFGTAIKLYLHDPRLKTVVNVVLSLLLVYAAVNLMGIP